MTRWRLDVVQKFCFKARVFLSLLKGFYYFHRNTFNMYGFVIPKSKSADTRVCLFNWPSPLIWPKPDLEKRIKRNIIIEDVLRIVTNNYNQFDA